MNVPHLAGEYSEKTIGQMEAAPQIEKRFHFSPPFIILRSHEVSKNKK